MLFINKCKIFVSSQLHEKCAGIFLIFSLNDITFLVPGTVLVYCTEITENYL